MSDNVKVNPGHKTDAVNVATDDVSGVQYQKIKVFSSSDGDARRLDKDAEATHTSNDPGIQILAVRKDSPGTLTGEDGTYSPLQVNEDGELRVVVTGTIDVDEIEIGTVDQGTAGSDPWSVKISQTGTDNNVDANITNASLAVTGTFWQVTQPVSGTVTVDDGGGSLTVDGEVEVTATNLDIRDLDSSTDSVTAVIDGTIEVDTGLPSPSVLSDTLPNPTTPQIGSNLLAYSEGPETWFRVRGNSSTGALFSGSFNHDGSAWIVTRGAETNTDEIEAVGSTGQLVTNSILRLWNEDDGKFVRARSNNDYILQVDGSNYTQPVSGTITANQGGAPWSVSGSGNFTVVQGTGSNLHTVVDSGTLTSITNVVHIDDNSSSLTVDNGGTFAVQDSQVVADNAGFTDGTTKLFMAGYIYDETAGTALTENDAAAPRINANRASVATIEDGTTRGRYATVSSDGAVSVRMRVTATPTQSSVASSASNTTLLASNSARAGFTIFNDSTQIVYIKLGATASSTSYTVQLQPNGYYESPAWNYTGIVDGIWVAANGNARITEF